MDLVTLLGGIVLEGLKLFNEERRKAIMNKHHNLITRLERALSRTMTTEDEYTDAEVAVSERELLAFIRAYAPELTAEITKISQAGVWPPKS